MLAKGADKRKLTVYNILNLNSENNNLNFEVLCLTFASFSCLTAVKHSPQDVYQPSPQGLLCVQNGGLRNPALGKVAKVHQKSWSMSSFRLNDGFRLLEINATVYHWK